MDLRLYFSASKPSSSSASKPSSSSASKPSNSSDSEDGSMSDIDGCETDVQPNPPKKHCSSLSKPPSKSGSGIRRYNKKWEETFPWLEFDEDLQGAFCKLCKKSGRPLQRTRGAWITRPFTNWKNAIQKMKSHSQSDVHLLSCQMEVEAERARREGSIIRQLQTIGEEQRLNNRKAIKALIRCTHFIAHQHIAHTANFNKLVDLVVSCGGQTLQTFLDSAGGNATYTSKMAVVEFVNALGTWVEESILKRLHQAPYFSIMSDECTDITTVEELTVCCRWVESGVPEEHFIEILPLKKVDAESIYSALVECCKQKNIQLGRLIGMGFDGAATFSGNKTGVQRRLKELSPHALFLHCHCHLLQLASVQAANATPGIKHVYITLMTLWKFFHYSPKCAESLREIQKVLDLPELKVVKPSETRWLAHERCVKQ